MNWLKEIRKNKGIMPKDIARLVGCSEVYIRKIEAGERRPSVKIAKEIAKALNFDWTLFYSDEPSEQDKSN